MKVQTDPLAELVAKTIYEKWYIDWPPDYPVDLGITAASFREVAAEVIEIVRAELS